MTTLHLYGIKNCDTMKKAFAWLDAQGLAYEFHDYKKEAPNEQLISVWLKTAGMEKVVNTRGTTWRKLSDAEKAITAEAEMATLLKRHSSAIKRPILMNENTILVGFSPDEWQQQLCK